MAKDAENWRRQKRNQLRQVVSQLEEGQAQAVEREATAAAEQARAEADKTSDGAQGSKPASSCLRKSCCPPKRIRKRRVSCRRLRRAFREQSGRTRRCVFCPKASRHPQLLVLSQFDALVAQVASKAKTCRCAKSRSSIPAMASLAQVAASSGDCREVSVDAQGPDRRGHQELLFTPPTEGGSR